MIQKPITERTIDDLNEWVTNSITSGLNLDYKRDLCGNGDRDKKEFMADFSSFVNANGGFLLFRVDEADGAAFAIPDLAGFEPDAALLRLESSILDGGTQGTSKPNHRQTSIEVQTRSEDPREVIRSDVIRWLNSNL